MKPRVFVSSTYYDLKYVRERIEKFFDNYGFDSVLFENDKVTYEHEKPIDESAYKEVTTCHIMVLIVGGRYGTQSSTQIGIKEEHKKYDNEYVSITRREFETALEKNIPIFIFIDKNVYAEYFTYKENQDFFEEFDSTAKGKAKGFKFAHVDTTNVFKFIDTLRSKPVKTFDKVEEIENYLQIQLAGLFYLYLDGLQKQKEVQKVLDSVTELNNVSLRMNEMLNSVGKKILGSGNSEYEHVINKQLGLIVDFFVDSFFDLLTFDEHEDEIDKETAQIISKVIIDNVLPLELTYPGRTSGVTRSSYVNQKDEEIKTLINAQLAEKNISIQISSIKAFRANLLYKKKVAEFIRDEEDIKLIIEKLGIIIYYIA